MTKYKLYLDYQREHNNLIMIFENIIRAALNYTRQGQVASSVRELGGTPNPRFSLHTRMIINNEEWSKALRD